MTGFTVRQAELADAEGVAAFTRDTWADRESGDYVPDAFEEWVRTDGDAQRTLVADAGDAIAGVVRATLLSDYEAWGQGIRVNPEYRGHGVSTAMTHEAWRWARERGATVLRVMVFSWNEMGLGQARSVGYEPVGAFRWAHPEPDAGATVESGVQVTAEADAAWSYWTASRARETLGGLALDASEGWACSELTRADLAGVADDDGLFVVRDDGTRGFAVRNRTFERDGDDGDDGPEEWAEYGLAAWDALDAARPLFDAIRRDAGRLGVDRTRVLLPETPGHVSEAAYARAGVDESPDFVLARDLTAEW